MHQRLVGGAVLLLGEGEVHFLAAAGGELDAGEVAVEAGCPLLPQLGAHPVQDVGHRPGAAVQLAKGTGVEVAEVHTGQKALVHLAQLQHLVQVAKLVDFSHGLHAQGNVAVPRAVHPLHNLAQIAHGDAGGLPPGALHQRAGVDGDPPGPHPVGGPAGGDDIASRLLQALGVGVGGVDEVGGVEGQDDPLLRRPGPQSTGGLLAHVHALAALVFVGVQAYLAEPARGVYRGFIGEGIGIACRAK